MVNDKPMPLLYSKNEKTKISNFGYFNARPTSKAIQVNGNRTRTASNMPGKNGRRKRVGIQIHLSKQDDGGTRLSKNQLDTNIRKC